MRKYLLLLTFMLLSVTSKAQVPRIDVTFKQKLAAQKANHYQQMMLCEQQKTANQEYYDVTYYSLDLTPDPTTSILDGIVEIVAEVIAPTLDQVELNFWGGMSITNVYLSGIPDVELSYDMNNDTLTIYLDRAYEHGEQFRLTVMA